MKLTEFTKNFVPCDGTTEELAKNILMQVDDYEGDDRLFVKTNKFLDALEDYESYLEKIELRKEKI